MKLYLCNTATIGIYCVEIVGIKQTWIMERHVTIENKTSLIGDLHRSVIKNKILNLKEKLSALI